MATTPAVSLTYNTDIYGLYRRLNRSIEEIVKSVSSGVSQTNAFDVNRAKANIGAVRSYTDWVVSQPALDLPETAPQTMALSPASIAGLASTTLTPLTVPTINRNIGTTQIGYAVVKASKGKDII